MVEAYKRDDSVVMEAYINNDFVVMEAIRGVVSG